MAPSRNSNAASERSAASISPRPEPVVLAMTSPGRLRRWAEAMRREVLVLWLAARDPRVPPLAKAIAAATVAYALSPIDLIPDFIPVLGLLDDLLLVPAGLWLALRLIPPDLVAELRIAAARMDWPGPGPGLAKWAALAIVAIWLALAAALALALFSGKS